MNAGTRRSHDSMVELGMRYIGILRGRGAAETCTWFDAVWAVRDMEQDKRQRERDLRTTKLRPILSVPDWRDRAEKRFWGIMD